MARYDWEPRRFSRENIELVWHRLMKRTVCRLVGHNKRIRKMRGTICSRCYTYTPFHR